MVVRLLLVAGLAGRAGSLRPHRRFIGYAQAALDGKVASIGSGQTSRFRRGF